MEPNKTEYEGLLYLLKASSKKLVNDFCNRAVLSMYGTTPDNELLFIQSQFSLESAEALKLFTSLQNLLYKAIYLGCQDLNSAQSLFPSDFHSNLRDLLAKIIVENQASWRKLAVENQVSFPKLTEFSWNIKEAHNMAPSCVINLNTSDKSSINVELSRSTLDTMIDSLSKIREQISSIAQ